MNNRKEEIIKITVPTPFAVGDVNMYLIKGDALTLIDAGVKTDEAQAAFLEQLATRGLVPEDIEQVVLTHHHPDHIGLLGMFSEEVPVYGHPYVRPWIEKDGSFMDGYDRFYKRLFVEFGIEGDFAKLLNGMKAPLRLAGTHLLTGEITEGKALPGLDGWSLIDTPGHAQSHLSFYREQDGVLIAGDHLLATISSNPLIEPALHPEDERPKPQLQYNDSLKRLLSLDLGMVYTGHGGEIKAAHPLIERRLERQHERAFKLAHFLQEQRLSTFAITKQLFPAVYEQQLGLTLSETTAQLDYLLSLEAIEKQMGDDGVAYFTRKRGLSYGR